MENKKGTKRIKTKTEKRKVWQRIAIVFGAVLVFVCSVLGVLQAGVVYTKTHWEHWRPDYEQIDISALLDKNDKTEDDYETLYRQTGLTKIGIDDLLQERRKDRIFAIQEFLFKEREVKIRRFNPFTYMEEVEGFAPMARMKDGDIIVTASVRVSWWRYGHAALVADGKNERLLESLSPGVESKYSGAYTFGNLANFMILRVNVDEEIKQQAVAYAKENLVGLPYSMTVGVLSKKYKEEIKKTQCAHLVWYAYKKAGIDLDSNGGGIVKPQDIANSPYVEVVQVVGYNLDTLWG